MRGSGLDQREKYHQLNYIEQYQPFCKYKWEITAFYREKQLRNNKKTLDDLREKFT